MPYLFQIHWGYIIFHSCTYTTLLGMKTGTAKLSWYIDGPQAGQPGFISWQWQGIFLYTILNGILC
jgi:hypothetical protein